MFVRVKRRDRDATNLEAGGLRQCDDYARADQLVSAEATESVWDYPRPPAVEPVGQRVRVELGGRMLADSMTALRVLETSHPPTVYIPPADVDMSLLVPSATRPTICEFKGQARYVDFVAESGRVPAIGWAYADPRPDYASLVGHLAFYPGRVDAAWIGDERVQAQAGDFYGGWITSNLSGPFKGGPGTLGW